MDPAEGQRRFCSQCDKHVHDLSAMTEPEARAVLTAPRSGRLCVRYRADTQGNIRFRVPSVRAPLPGRFATTVRTMRTAMAAGLIATLGASSGCTDPNRAPSSIESDRCTYEVGPFSYSLERGEGSCPGQVADPIAMGAVALDPEPPPVKGELVPVEVDEVEMGEEVEPAPMGKIALPVDPPPPEAPCMGQAPAEVELVELMGDVAAPTASKPADADPADAIPSGPPPALGSLD